MKLLRWALALLVLSVMACDNEKDQGPAEVNVHFKADFGGKPLTMYTTTYDYEAGMKVKFQLFQFYVSDLALIKETSSGTDSLVLVDIALVNYKDVQTQEAALAGITLSAKDIPPGKYKGIQFGLGVSPDLNATSPNSYTPPHPLDGNYWSWARGYIFTKVEGNADLNNDGQFETSLTFHIGENEFYRRKVFLQDLEIKPGANDLNVAVDLRRVLVAGAGNFLDFRVVTVDHTTDRNVAKFISDNLEAAVTFKGKE